MSDNPQHLHIETTQVRFSLGTGEFKMNASAQVPAGKTTPTQLLPVLRQLTDSIMSGVAEMFEAAGTPISCRMGCAACCRQPVPVNLFEAEALAAWMRSLPVERQQELLARFSVAVQRLRESGLLAQMGSTYWTQTAEESERFMLEYKRAGIDCPFLENESCGIHPIRPLICREYVVISPPEFCGPPVKEKVKRIDIPIRSSDALFRMGSRIERNQRGWIPLVFLAEWMKGQGSPGEGCTGTGPEVLYAFVQHLSPAEGESSPAQSAG